MGIGYRIKEARENQGLTQMELGKIVGVTGSAITNYENETSHPKESIMYKLIEALKVDANYLFQDCVRLPNEKNDITLSEYEHIKKYRKLDPQGQETVSYILDKETERVQQLNKQVDRIKELENQTTSTRIIAYYQKLASAGPGEYLFPEIPTDTIAVKDSPISRTADFVIGVNGESMEPDYYDGEKVFVKKTTELDIGEVGVFVQDNACYIKELGETHLISRNKDCSDIIPVNEVYIVGKVIGKVEE